ncbi:MAG: hypothetical protein M3Z32_09840 [Acidobacteriota bacterium]|nr:hypothetical protein [Acidobacteriota bacterium]
MEAPSVAAFTAFLDELFTPYQQAIYRGVLFTDPLVFQLRPESIYDRKKNRQGYCMPWTISLTPGSHTKHLVLATRVGSLAAISAHDVLVDLPELRSAFEVRFTPVRDQSDVHVHADLCLAAALCPARRLREGIESLIIVAHMVNAAILPYWQ